MVYYLSVLTNKIWPFGVPFLLLLWYFVEVISVKFSNIK